MKCSRKIAALLIVGMGLGVEMSAMDKPKGFVTKAKEALSFKLTPEKATLKLHALIAVKNTKRISIKDVAKLIEARADINVRNKAGETILEIAVDQNNGQLVAYLLEKGANPNLGIPLVRAVINDKPEIVTQLIKAGTYPDQYQDGRISALWHAVYRANPDMVRILLEAGANVNTQTVSGNTPLHQILERSASGEVSRDKRISIIKLLLAYGADITLANQGMQTPLAIARRLNDQEIMNLFTMQRKKKLA